MKNPLRHFCLFIFLLSLVALAISTTAPRASAAGSGNSTVFHLNGRSAVALFDSFSPDGCIENFAFINFTQSQQGPEASALIFQENTCTVTLLLYATGGTFNFTSQVSGTLDSASLSATIPVLDAVSGNTFDASVSTTWTATGPLSREVTTDHFQTKTFIETFHLNETFRDASASGTVSIGTTNFTPSPALGASIFSTLTGDVRISLS
jgi:hypothetical protein